LKIEKPPPINIHKVHWYKDPQRIIEEEFRKANPNKPFPTIRSAGKTPATAVNNPSLVIKDTP